MTAPEIQSVWRKAACRSEGVLLYLRTAIHKLHMFGSIVLLVEVVVEDGATTDKRWNGLYKGTRSAE